LGNCPQPVLKGVGRAVRFARCGSPSLEPIMHFFGSHKVLRRRRLISQPSEEAEGNRSVRSAGEKVADLARLPWVFKRAALNPAKGCTPCAHGCAVILHEHRWTNPRRPLRTHVILTSQA